MKKSTRTIAFSVGLLILLIPVLVCAKPLGKADLGKLLYEDTYLSFSNNQSCETCHKAPGFADPANAVDPVNLPVSVGSNDTDGLLYGTRNAPSSAYAAASPKFAYVDGVGYVGGQFWDGRANGLKAQAKGPFTNPVEMALSGPADVLAHIADSENFNYTAYLALFKNLYNLQIDKIDLTDPKEVRDAYDNVADAIAIYERSSELNKFNSRYDEYLASNVNALTDLEQMGAALFYENCRQCHPSDGTVTNHSVTMPTVLSNFTYHNLGLPHNDVIDDLTGEKNPPDLGLGGRADIADPLEVGKFKTPTLRNIALTAPYGHNGYFAYLEDIVHFLNTREDFGGVALIPEVSANMTDQVGNLNLSLNEEAAIVAFLMTLSDQ